ncbi:hypothetical protein ACIBJE_08435 [Micromonospora sp. NPDC050187]
MRVLVEAGGQADAVDSGPLAAQAAHGYALLGDRAATDRLLGRQSGL